MFPCFTKRMLYHVSAMHINFCMFKLWIFIKMHCEILYHLDCNLTEYFMYPCKRILNIIQLYLNKIQSLLFLLEQRKTEGQRKNIFKTIKLLLFLFAFHKIPSWVLLWSAYCLFGFVVQLFLYNQLVVLIFYTGII